MKRSEINAVIHEAADAFARHGWALPPTPRWDVTDFGLGDFARCGLVLINLAEHPEYCEKIMYARNGQITPRHYHAVKKEDIICRFGRLVIDLGGGAEEVILAVNGAARTLPTREPLVLTAGERVTLTPGIQHAFWPESAYAIIGEVSTANDDRNDNFFADPRVGRYSEIEEDEPASVHLIGEGGY
ncbi:MAG: D-lyxose/D-mannose family sugar isomerase [Verrucomicrobia bacterium]|nr:D-lyxose/D-mannose family sugar isomerase [Verrucomicrobiota bacterium]